MPTTTTLPPATTVRDAARPLTGVARDYDPLLDLIGGAQVVLLGEASHGTHEFYYERAQITRRLIQEKGFIAVAVEADWPDAYRVNRWVRGTGGDRTALDALGGFERFPRWMWRNRDVLAFVEWLRQHNSARPADTARTGFYGLDLYSLFASMEEVVIYHPETERVSHYFEARLPQQVDAVIHFDKTRAVEPLDRTAGWDEGEPPETFPTGL